MSEPITAITKDTVDELVRLPEKPDVNNCTFSCYKTWVFENYLLCTGNRISTVFDLHIGDINFQSGVIILRKTKNRKQQIIPLSTTLAGILQEYVNMFGQDLQMDFEKFNPLDNLKSRNKGIIKM